MSSDNSPQLPPKNTPWEEWDHADHLGNGVYCITTPSHGDYTSRRPCSGTCPTRYESA